MLILFCFLFALLIRYLREETKQIKLLLQQYYLYPYYYLNDPCTFLQTFRRHSLFLNEKDPDKIKKQPILVKRMEEEDRRMNHRLPINNFLFL